MMNEEFGRYVFFCKSLYDATTGDADRAGTWPKTCYDECEVRKVLDCRNNEIEKRVKNELN
jgi:hypothetical protein